MSLWVGLEGRIPSGEYHDTSQSYCNSHLFRVKRPNLTPMAQIDETKRTKRFPSFPLSNKDIMDKTNKIIILVETSFYALPFLVAKRVINDEESESDKPKSIDEIKDKLTKDSYVTTCEILNDMDELFDSQSDQNLEEITFKIDKRQRKVNVLADERKKMGKEMKKKTPPLDGDKVCPRDDGRETRGTTYLQSLAKAVS